MSTGGRRKTFPFPSFPRRLSCCFCVLEGTKRHPVTYMPNCLIKNWKSFCGPGAILFTRWIASRSLSSFLRGRRSTQDAALHPSHFPLHTLHSTLYTLHTAHLHPSLLSPHPTLDTEHATYCTPHATLHLHFVRYTLHSALDTLHYTPHSKFYCTFYTITLFAWQPQCTLNSTYTPCQEGGEDLGRMESLLSINPTHEKLWLHIDWCCIPLCLVPRTWWFSLYWSFPYARNYFSLVLDTFSQLLIIFFWQPIPFLCTFLTTFLGVCLIKKTKYPTYFSRSQPDFPALIAIQLGTKSSVSFSTMVYGVTRLFMLLCQLVVSTGPNAAARSGENNVQNTYQ